MYYYLWLTPMYSAWGSQGKSQQRGNIELRLAGWPGVCPTGTWLVFTVLDPTEFVLWWETDGYTIEVLGDNHWFRSVYKQQQKAGKEVLEYDRIIST